MKIKGRMEMKGCSSFLAFLGWFARICLICLLVTLAHSSPTHQSLRTASDSIYFPILKQKPINDVTTRLYRLPGSSGLCKGDVDAAEIEVRYTVITNYSGVRLAMQTASGCFLFSALEPSERGCHRLVALLHYVQWTFLHVSFRARRQLSTSRWP